MGLPRERNVGSVSKIAYQMRLLSGAAKNGCNTAKSNAIAIERFAGECANKLNLGRPSPVYLVSHPYELV
jgi:hypothetical protein